MDGFSNLDETRSQTSVGFSTATFRQRLESIRQAWQIRSTLEKGLLIAVVALSILALGLTIGLAASGGKDNDNTPEPSPEVCLTPGCTMAASRILESLDRSVNPCSDFYAYACGSWRKTHVIPDDSTSTDVFSTLGNKIQMINKNLYEDPNNVDAKEDAWRKAKDMYTSCMDTELLEKKNLSVITPVLEALGGWPIFGAQPGGKWNESRFDLVALLVQLAQYGIQPIMQLDVVVDPKNSTQHVLQLWQSFAGYPDEADLTFAKSMARLFGADPAVADTEMRQVLQFQRKLNSISMSTEELQNPDTNYNKMTLAEIRGNFTEPRSTDTIQFSWSNFVRGIMGLEGVLVSITEKEPIVVTTVPYFQKLFGVLQQASKRTIVNFIIWSFMENSDLTLALPVRFKEIYNHYQKEVSGQLTPEARWRECETLVTTSMGLAISQKFVKQEFDDTARQRTGEMIKNIRAAFNELLQDVGWMNDHTKGLAKEKAEAIKNRIGYPDDLLSDIFINWIYKDVIVDREAFLLNILNFLKVFVIKTLKQLRQPYDKTAVTEVWSPTSLPISVNAFYSYTLNDIIIPAGVLHSPFYGKNEPQSLNYGSIGTLIGHEITHGFDNTGRRYNKYGDLKQWWDQKIIDNFNRQATCMVNQYGSYVVPEVNKTINGNLTLGENIADNGGLKQSYRAYRRWVQRQGKEEPKLPGLDLTHNQLFFVSFAQHWCMNVNKQTARSLLLTDTHSPDQFRVIGSLQNSEEFAAAFSCPRKSYMNPEKKCSVW